MKMYSSITFSYELFFVDINWLRVSDNFTLDFFHDDSINVFL